MQLLLNFLGLVSSLMLSFISSGMETALYRVSRVRMRIRAEQGEARARLVLAVLDRLDGMVTTILINNNIAAYTGTYFLTIQLVRWGGAAFGTHHHRRHHAAVLRSDGVPSEADRLQ